MPATYQFSESNGAGETPTDGIANLNFGDIDAPNLVPATYPIVAGTNSYQKYFRAKFTGSFTEISNMKFWKSVGAYKTGETCKGAVNVAYVQPVKTAEGGDTDIPEVEGSAWAVQAADGSATITPPEDYTKYIRLQLRTTGSTPAGSVNQKTYTLQYDEV
jgi:hypothetical protein